MAGEVTRSWARDFSEGSHLSDVVKEETAGFGHKLNMRSEGERGVKR